MTTDLNYLAIVVAALVFFIVGGIWYAAVFGKPWQNALSLNPEETAQAQQDFPKALAVWFLSGLIISFVLANFARALGAASFGSGIMVGFWTWLGFALPLNLNSLAFEKRAPHVFLINVGFYWVTFALMGGILAAWR
ncbi:MAG: DUF1761 domain-containing protein [Gemmatimonadales bacterium]|nr:DUF1761 domain-containing protein [Gemmatimonadales bacterium]